MQSNIETAKQNFLLGIANGDSFEWSFESGALFLDTKQEENEYAAFCADWETGRAKGDVDRYDIESGLFYNQTIES